MAKYDWKQLEKEYILSDYKSVSQFIKSKEIPYNGTTKSRSKGWTEKKRLKQDQKATKIVEKVIEKESEKEAQQIVDIKTIAKDLALNIMKSNTELHIHMDMFGGQHKGIVDAGRLKKLTSALKDINDILGNEYQDNDNRVQIINDLPEDKKNE